jgi:hypothetical protein
MSPLRGSDVLSSDLSKGGLYLDIALCGLCANIVFFAVKNIKAQPPFFNTKAAKVRKGASQPNLSNWYNKFGRARNSNRWRQRSYKTIKKVDRSGIN